MSFWHIKKFEHYSYVMGGYQNSHNIKKIYTQIIWGWFILVLKNLTTKTNGRNFMFLRVRLIKTRAHKLQFLRKVKVWLVEWRWESPVDLSLKGWFAYKKLLIRGCNDKIKVINLKSNCLQIANFQFQDLLFSWVTFTFIHFLASHSFT